MLRGGSLLLLGACGRLGFGTAHDDAAHETAGDASPDALDVDALLGSFGPPTLIPGFDNSADEVSPSIGTHGLELYFTTPRVGGYTIWVAVRATSSGQLGAANLFVEVDGAGAIEFHAEVSQDGLELLYASNAAPYGLRQTTRTALADPWSAPSVVATPTDREGPSLCLDDLRMFVSIPNTGNIEEYARANRNNPWLVVRVHPTLDGFTEPGIRSDGLELYAVQVATNQLFRTTRATVDGPFDPPQRVLFGTPIDAMIIGGPELSDDGHTLYFSAKPSGGMADIYMTTR